MPDIAKPALSHYLRITADDVCRFTDTVEIRDAAAFAAELQVFVNEQLTAAGVLVDANTPVYIEAEDEPARDALAHKASRLRAHVRWTPSETDIQRGRDALLKTFNQPHNLTIPEFARLAGKSRQQIYKDIAARLLLALDIGRRGQKLPDWQLDPVKQRLTQIVLQHADDIDNWTVYRALSEPLEGLGGRSPVDTVTSATLNDIARVALNVMGVQTGKAKLQ